ncbi:hypothetical protein A6302_00402 [Methylobrevis pamukkalensis]|uniref:Uncharacterized protein n=1 Tax=Methylobrevis pamukkalensis TaxID=1439726 RepID=A0A1E3H7A2_9HYPH|nr:hypothetical protein A6302_00402 [Methylobrevis pamukkalensis]
MKRLPLLLLASLLMGAGLWFGAGLLAPWLTPSAGLLASAAALLALVTGGMLLFAVFAALTGAIDFRRYGGMVLARAARRKTPGGP